MAENVLSVLDTPGNTHRLWFCGRSLDRGGDDARQAHHHRPDRRRRRTCRCGAQRRRALGPV